MTVKGKMAGVTDAEFRQLKKFMSDCCFTCTDEWLMACMNWIKENNRSVNFEVWKRELSEQWKDANLEEMESVCLPPNLSNQRLVKLPGKYGLQVNAMRDIGESSYSQWTKLKKLENENVTVAATDSTEYTPTWQPTPKRCLYLTMTDGKQQVFGLEMQPIAGLNLNMKPGLKVIITGPVDCRRGVVHLKPNNVRVIGGEVDDLVEANRMEKILADTLKLTAVPSQLTQPSTRQNLQLDNTSNASRRARTPGSSAASTTDEEIMGDFPDSEDPFPDIGADDDIFMEIDEEALMRTASNTSTEPAPKSSNPPTRSKSQMTTQKIPTQQNILKYMKPMPVIIDPPTPQRVKRRRRSEEQPPPAASVSKRQPQVPLITEDDCETQPVAEMESLSNEENTDFDEEYMSNNSPPDDSLLRIVDETLESKLLECDTTEPCSSSSVASDSQKKSYPVVVSDLPYIYLAQIQAELDKLKCKREVVQVKACISTVVSNIQVDNGCWTLCVCINDGTGYLNCKINANILNNIIGFTPAEMKKIKAAKTKEGKQKIADGMNNLARELVHLNAVFAIEIGEQPMITEIIDFKLHHSAGLKKRLFELGL